MADFLAIESKPPHPPGDGRRAFDQQIPFLAGALRQGGQKSPFADAVAGKDDVVGAAFFDQGAQNQRGERQGLGAARGYFFDLQQRFARQIGENGGDPRNFVGRDLVAVDDVQRMFRLTEEDVRDRPPRAAGDVEAAALEAAQPREGGELALDHVLRALAAAIGALGQNQVTQHQARAPADLAAVERDQLEAAAAEIAQEAVGVGDAREQAESGKTGFLGPAQHPDGDMEPAFDSGDERTAVLGLANRGRRERPDPADSHRPGETNEPRQRRHRAIPPVGVEPAGIGEAAGQGAMDLFVEQRGRQRGDPLVDDETNGVRPDVDDRRARQRGGLFLRHDGARRGQWPPHRLR